MRLTGLAIAFLLLPSLAQAQVTLRYRWSEGDTITYRITARTTVAISGLPGMGEVSADQRMTQTIKLLVSAVAPDGTGTLQETIEAMSLEMNLPSGKISYDSSAPKASEPGPPSTELVSKLMGAMVGARITAVIASDGAVRSIDGATRLLDKIVQSLPVADPMAQQMLPALKSALSDEAMRASQAQSFSRLPSQPVKPGDTWTGEMSLGDSTTGKMLAASTSTLKSLDGQTATVGMALTVKYETAPPPGPGGAKVTLGDSRGDGEVQFDAAAGRIRRSTIHIDVPTTLSLTGPDGQPLTVTHDTKIALTMEEVR